jgi:hypothetical protein
MRLGKGMVFVAVEAVQPCFDLAFVQDKTVTKFVTRFIKQFPFSGETSFPLHR